MTDEAQPEIAQAPVNDATRPEPEIVDQVRCALQRHVERRNRDDRARGPAPDRRRQP